jgi:predicted DsbA family dithiol-disulfide isomerase
LICVGRLELDPAETDAALREHTFRERVLADIEGGRRAGVHATPTFFVDGERLDRPWRELPQIVRASLTARASPAKAERDARSTPERSLAAPRGTPAT